MVSIVSSYPGFHRLPRGIKQLLVTSETEFFDEAKPSLLASAAKGSPAERLAHTRTIGLEQRISSGYSAPSWN